jgi:GTP cyclohydrolase II
MTSAPRFQIRKATLHLGERRLAEARGVFDVHFFRDLARETTAMAISTGTLDRAEPVLARVHSSCVTSECLLGRDCDCAEQLEAALAMMAEAGRGVVFYLLQEGRGAGLSAKARDRMMVQASGHRLTTFEAYSAMGLPSDLRSYEVVAPMARLLGVRAPIRLLTNNPEKVAAVGAALATEKLEVASPIEVQGEASPFNHHYLEAKRSTGHALQRSGNAGDAQPPIRPHVFEPFALPGDASRVVTASYFLPIGLPGRASQEDRPVWFRASVLYDRERTETRMRLTPLAAEVGREADGAAYERALAERLMVAEEGVEMGLLDRLPFREARSADVQTGGVVRSEGRRRLESALRRIDDQGFGAVEVRFDERDGSPA